jgi:hypothetical protein
LQLKLILKPIRADKHLAGVDDDVMRVEPLLNLVPEGRRFCARDCTTMNGTLSAPPNALAVHRYHGKL